MKSVSKIWNLIVVMGMLLCEQSYFVTVLFLSTVYSTFGCSILCSIYTSLEFRECFVIVDVLYQVFNLRNFIS